MNPVDLRPVLDVNIAGGIYRQAADATVSHVIAVRSCNDAELFGANRPIIIPGNVVEAANERVRKTYAIERLSNFTE